MQGPQIKDEVQLFIEANRHLTRVELNKQLKRKFNIGLMYRKYSRHTGFKERVRNLTRLGKTPDEILEVLEGVYGKA